VFLFKFFHILLVVSLLFVHQAQYAHTKHLLIQDNSCQVCVSQSLLDVSFHESNFFFVQNHQLENMLQKESLISVKKQKTKSPILAQQSNLQGQQTFEIAFLPLGYFSHAPPLCFS